MSKHENHPLVMAIWAYHDKPERWDALRDVHAQLPDPVFFDTFAHVWSNSETNHLNLGTIDELVLLRGVNAEKVVPHLPKADQRFYAALPDMVTVWRGATTEEPFTDYSWSTSKRKATWFGRRCSQGTPTLFMGQVPKEDILFVYTGRGESEVAVVTDNVHDIESFNLGPYKVDERFEVYAMAQSGLLFPPESMIELRIKHEVLLAGRPLAEVKAQLYAHVDRLAQMGFATKSAKDLAMLDGIDWSQFEQQECAA